MNKRFLVVAWIFFLEALIIGLLIPGEFTEKQIQKETIYIENSFGVEGKKYIADKSFNWFNSQIVESGLYANVHNFFIPTQQEQQKSDGLENLGKLWFQIVNNRLQALKFAIQQMYIRIAIFTMWLPYVVQFLIASICYGWYIRQIKRTNFSYASPTINRYSMIGIFNCIVASIFLFFIPFAIHPVILPCLIVVAAVLTGSAIGNTQKRL